MCLCWKPPHYSIQFFRHDQVLTGVSPYHGSKVKDMTTDIRAGKRPPHPINPSGNRWLPDPVWEIITTSWHNQPNRRPKLSVYHICSLPSPQEVQHVKSGGLNAQNDGNLTIGETSQTPKRRLGNILPRIASFFQFLQSPESEIQRQVNKMNDVSISTSPLPQG